MAMVSSSFMDMMNALSKARTQVQDMKMGQRHGYSELQQAMNSQMNSALLAQNQGMMGQLAQLGIANTPNPYEQILNNPNCSQGSIYPSQVLYPDGYRRAFPNDRDIQELAIMHDFTYKFDADYFLHKNGGTVSRRQLEDCNRSDLPKLFVKAKTPNISWLEDRVNEVRVKLC